MRLARPHANDDEFLAPIDARKALAGSPLAGHWVVSRARKGSSGRTFVAVDGAQRVFLKFDVALEPLQRLAQLGVTPQVLHAGEYRGRLFVVQPFVGGHHPPHGWIAAHLPQLAGLVGAYQGDARIRDLTRAVTVLTYLERVSDVIEQLEHRADSLDLPNETHRPIEQAIAALRRQSMDLPATEPVATHGDPSLKNFVLTDALYLVDWDDLALSDALRDIGQLLWWYVPPNRWDDFLLENLARDPGDGVRDRLYWWVAAESLEVAIMLEESGDRGSATAFLADVAAAIEQRANPRARF